MHDFVWPITVLVIVVIALLGFRRSISKLIQGAKLRKAPGGFEFDQAPQQQIEGTKEEPKPAIAKAIQGNLPIDDPVVGLKIRAILEDLKKVPQDPAGRENALVVALASSQVNWENSRIARLIFGSQLEILLHLNTRPSESLEFVRTFYDRAVRNFPSTYNSYPFEQYLGFLEMTQLVIRENQQVWITPIGKAFLHYIVATGDTAPRPN
jgi:hypothetical protein